MNFESSGIVLAGIMLRYEDEGIIALICECAHRILCSNENLSSVVLFERDT